MCDRIVTLLALCVLGSGLGACVFDADGDLKATLLAADDASPGRTFFIGGSVEGVTGVLTLQNSNGRTLTLARNGAFAFETQMVSSAIYNVTVAVQPESQTCRVARGSGTVNDADVRNVVVTCTPATTER